MRQHLNKLEIHRHTDKHTNRQTLSFVQNNLGQDQSGTVRTGQDRPGQVGTGRDRSRQVGTGQDKSGQVRTGDLRIYGFRYLGIYGFKDLGI